MGDSTPLRSSVGFSPKVEIIEPQADLSFQIRLSEIIDRFRRIINADIYMPGSCVRLAERCEALLSHLKENTIHLPEVAGLEADFLPVFGLCTQIAKFLEKTGEMSWSARRILEKDDLSEKAKTYSHRVDDVSCQVMIKLNIRARSPRYASFSSTSSSLESDHCPRRGSTDSADNRIPLESDDGSSTHQSVHQNTNVIVAKHARRTVSIVFISVFIMGVIWILVSQ